MATNHNGVDGNEISELVRYRFEQLEQGQTEIKESIRQFGGQVTAMHESISKLAAGAPGFAANCVAHGLRIDSIEKRIEKHLTDNEARLRTLEYRLYWAMGVVAAVVLFSKLLLPALENALKHPTTHAQPPAISSPASLTSK